MENHISKMSSRNIIFTPNLSGHYKSYANALNKITGWELFFSKGTLRDLIKLMFSKGVFFVSVDICPILFFCTSVIRKLIGRDTHGISIRVHLFAGERLSLRKYVRYCFFRIIRFFSLAKIYSIAPFDYRRNLHLISYDWVHDPELWDLIHFQDSVELDRNFSLDLSNFKQDRKLICFTGAVTKRKGWVEFMSYIKSSPPDSCFLIAGLVDKRYTEIVDDISFISKKFFGRVLVINRYITDQELFAIYAFSEKCWVKYEGDYDLSSGALGRSIQFGVDAICNDSGLVRYLKEGFVNSKDQTLRYRTFNQSLQCIWSTRQKLNCSSKQEVIF